MFFKKKTKQVVSKMSSPSTKESYEAEQLKKSSSEYSSELGQKVTLAIFLWWANKKGAPSSKPYYYPQYFKFKYGINDPLRFHSILINRGLLVKPAPEDCLSSMKVSELKDLCTKFSLPTKGKKAELIDTLLQGLSQEEKNIIVSESDMYVLSSDASKYIDQYSDYIELHKCQFQISLDEYEKAKQELPFKGSFLDVCWAIFNERIIKYSGPDTIGLKRNNFYDMAHVSMQRHNGAGALQYLLTVLLCDASDANNQTMWLRSVVKDVYEKKEVLEEYSPFLSLPPQLMKDVYDYQKFFSEEMIDLCYTFLAPIKLLPREIFCSIISEIFGSGTCNLADYESDIISLFKKNLSLIK